MTVAPFLSVISRTQGRRPHTLAAALTSLKNQTDQDFELLLMAHNVDRGGLSALQAVLDTLPQRAPFARRLIAVRGGTRVAPLNAGLDAASGEFLAILDDDDLTLPDWVATFHRLATQAPGHMLRAATRQQRVVEQRLDGVGGAAPVGDLEAAFPDQFDIFEHLSANRTPPVALAFPLERLRALGLRFDDALTTTEDWDFILRCAGPLGVAESSQVTSIYRYWETGECSRTVHSDAEWQANYIGISAKLDAGPFVLPAGSFLRLRKLVNDMALASTELGSLRGQLADNRERIQTAEAEITALCESRQVADARVEAAAAEIAALRQAQHLAESSTTRLLAIERSTSWRLTGPLRWLAARLRGHRSAADPNRPSSS